jgi:hypothetical protein
MRAEYADEIANKVMHPWPSLRDDEWEKAVRTLHEAVTSLIEPTAAFLHQAEAAYLRSRPRGAVRVRDLR